MSGATKVTMCEAIVIVLHRFHAHTYQLEIVIINPHPQLGSVVDSHLAVRPLHVPTLPPCSLSLQCAAITQHLPMHAHFNQLWTSSQLTLLHTQQLLKTILHYVFLATLLS